MNGGGPCRQCNHDTCHLQAWPIDCYLDNSKARATCESLWMAYADHPSLTTDVGYDFVGGVQMAGHYFSNTCTL